MMFPEGRDSKKVDERYHEIRHKAATETFSLAEWSEEEILRWDLDKGVLIARGEPLGEGELGDDSLGGENEWQPVPTGRDVARNYQWDRPIKGIDKDTVDLRTLDNR